MKLEHVQCDLCGENSYELRYRKPDDWLWLNQFEYPVVKCVNCGLVYVNPRPTFEEMGQFYPVGYHDGRDDPNHQVRYLNQYDYIKNFKANRILDIGCARGDWLNFIKDQNPGCELHGVDAFSAGVNSDEIIFHKCALTDANLDKDYFDLITSWAVIEHVHTPSDYFTVVSKVLKPGGKFVFLVTNSESLYGKYAYKEDIPRHLYHFSERSLSAYAIKHGLILDRIDYDERFWDGSGKGAIRHFFRRLLSISWHDMKSGKISITSRLFLRGAALLDKLVFCSEWEKRLKRSGIIVVTMAKGMR